jgi:hypothetical protein
MFNPKITNSCMENLLSLRIFHTRHWACYRQCVSRNMYICNVTGSSLQKDIVIIPIANITTDVDTFACHKMRPHLNIYINRFKNLNLIKDLFQKSSEIQSKTNILFWFHFSNMFRPGRPSPC